MPPDNDITPNRKFSWRRLLRFNLRTMLLIILLVSAWLAWHLDRAKQQKRAVDAVIKAGGRVSYDFQFDGDPVHTFFRENTESPYPEFMLDSLGYDFFHSVVGVVLAGDQERIKNRRLSTEWAKHLAGLKNLRFACIKGSQIDDEVLKRLGKLKHLTSVRAWGVYSISDEGIKDLLKSRKIEIVSFTNTSLTDESLKHLSKLPKIEEIELQGNFSDEGLKYLRGRTELKLLNVFMSKERITNRGLRELYGLKNLQILTIRGLDATQNEVNLLKQQLDPACKVNFSPKQRTRL